MFSLKNLLVASILSLSASALPVDGIPDDDHPLCFDALNKCGQNYGGCVKTRGQLCGVTQNFPVRECDLEPGVTEIFCEYHIEGSEDGIPKGGCYNVTTPESERPQFNPPNCAIP